MEMNRSLHGQTAQHRAHYSQAGNAEGIAVYTLHNAENRSLTPDHLCLFFDSFPDLCSSIAPVLTTSLLAGDQVLCVLHKRGRSRLIDYLRGTGWDIDPNLFSRQLDFEKAEEFFLTAGSFSPHAVLDRLGGRIDEALSRGYPNLFLIADMGWILGGVRGSECLIEYETELNGFLKGKKCSILCTYGLKEFTPAILLYVLVTHPKLVGRSSICNNLYYGTSPCLLTGDTPSNILGRWLQKIEESGPSRRGPRSV
ncbi:MAG TPA: MEDS domain-containing protein [Syntrophobacteraceae bacterium]|nr:MEDS domain-containing protein [Syntrophobacteraceae bacterium]